MTVRTITDLMLLSALLAVPGRMVQRSAFQGMFDTLMEGKHIRLSRLQRRWAEQVFLQYGLEDKPLPTKLATPTRGVEACQPVSFGPTPKRPPGK